MTGSTFITRRRGVAVTSVTALAAALVLALAPAGSPQAPAPALSLGPVSIGNGTATVSGSVTGTPSAGYQLYANGQPLGVAADGTFAGTVNLAGQSVLSLTARNPLSGETVATQIPLTTSLVGAGGVISGTVLDALKRAGISLRIPEGGFVSVDGAPVRLEGRVVDRDELAGLKVNGADVLEKLSSNGSFTQVVPGTRREVSVTATDRQGVSQTTSFGVAPTSSVIGTAAGPSVAAAGADGLVIARVRYLTKTARPLKRFRMIVTVKDRRGRLVRNATVRVRPTNFQVRKRFVVGKQRTKRSTKTGQANFLVLVRKHALGKRLFLVTAAQTPRAKAQKTTSVRLPKAKRMTRAGARR
jgi:hypothetical protein